MNNIAKIEENALKGSAGGLVTGIICNSKIPQREGRCLFFL